MVAVRQTNTGRGNRWLAATKRGLLVASIAGVIGCAPGQPTAQPGDSSAAPFKPVAPPRITKPSSPAGDPTVANAPVSPAKPAPRATPGRGRGKADSAELLAGSPPEKLKLGVLERVDAAKMVAAELEKSSSYAPTLVVWLVDRSASCREMVNEFSRLFRQFTDTLPRDGSGDDAKLLTAVVTFGSDVQFAVESPSADPESISTAIDAMSGDTSGKELAFTAVQQALDKFLKYRTEKQREVLFVVLTDESGDDEEMVDKLIETPKKVGIPFYVVGVPAPFGKQAALTPQSEAGLDYKPSGNWLVIRQGPESRGLERIRLGYWGGSTELDVMDSGFGPFAWEWLCRSTGGRFLALRPDTSEFAFVSALNSQWPSPGALRFAPDVMRKYAPDYVPLAEYQALLASNKAKKALADAANLGDVELNEFPQTAFAKADEPTMAKVLSTAQQVAAKLEPLANRWYEALEKGEADRAKITEPRWQAAFDLAIGRAAAVKSKVDGYNTMLAALKRGKPFQNPASTAWVLEPADTVEGASALQKLIDKSKMYLTRVIQEHPGTPWAKLAEKELQTPCGWKWVEK